MAFLVLILLSIPLLHFGKSQSIITDDVPNPLDETKAWMWYSQYQKRAEQLLSNKTQYLFGYIVNANKKNWLTQVQADQIYAEFRVLKKRVAEQYRWREFQDQTLKKLFNEMTNVEPYKTLPAKLFLQNRELLGELQQSRWNKRLCSTNNGRNTCFTKQELSKKMKNATTADNILTWNDWHDQMTDLKSVYLKLVSLENMAARQRGYNNIFDTWLQEYELTSLTEIESIMQQLRPFYQQLHTYVRHKISEKMTLPTTGHIPADAFENLDGSNWASHEFDPFFNISSYGRISDLLKHKNYTVRSLARLAESFYTSIGLPRLPNSLWTRSVMEDPFNVENLICTGASWDISKLDRRISLCGDVSKSTLFTLLTLIGYTQFSMGLEEQLFDFRAVPNIAVASSLGGVAQKSVLTIDYLQKIGLVAYGIENNNNQADLNLLMMEALSTLPAMHFYFVLEKWREAIFKNASESSDFNQLYWDLRCQWQGVSPPTRRPIREGFDAASIEEIATHRSTLGYLLAFPMTYEWYQSLCRIKGHEGPLHKCNLYQSPSIAPSLRNMLSLGKSSSWRQGHRYITGKTTVSASAMLDYFKPLQQWLTSRNGEQKNPVEWEQTCATDNFKKNDKEDPCLEETPECDTGVKEALQNWILDFIRNLGRNRNSGG